jgi:septum formation protein
MRTKIILASASPRRIDLLKKWGLRFKVIPSRIRENTDSKKPSDIVKDLALKKALSVARNIKSGVIIGADTIVVLNGKIIGKPGSEKGAVRILSRLSGTFHKVYSGIAAVDAESGFRKTDYDVSRVKMRKLSDREIREASSRHLDKAGAYAVQEKGDAFVEKIEGDYFNVVGLPYKKLKILLKRFDISIRNRGGRLK